MASTRSIDHSKCCCNCQNQIQPAQGHKGAETLRNHYGFKHVQSCAVDSSSMAFAKDQKVDQPGCRMLCGGLFYERVKNQLSINF